MSVYKPFITSDIVTSPFEVNKSFTFKGDSELTASNVSIDRYIGRNRVFISGSDTTGLITTQYQKLIYSSIKELYYSNFLEGPAGSPAGTASFNIDGTITGPIYTPNYYNYLSTTLTQSRYFPTGSSEKVLVFSIPSNLYGEYIKPGSFILECNNDGINWTEDVTITDDGNGNLLSSSINIGNIIYEHGIAILTQQDWGISALDLENMYEGLAITCSFESTITIHESQYKCTLRQNEFNFSQNPTLISGSSLDGVLYNFATSSYFTSYVTTVGMYNNAKELIAVAKLAQPLPISQVTDTSILVNLDL
jgi:hypothetical protein